MALTAADERQHPPGSDHAWQETMWFGAYDQGNKFTLDMHLTRQPHRRGHGTRIEVNVIAVLDGEVISLGGIHGGDDLFAIPGLELGVIDPMKHFRLKFRGRGNVGSGQYGIYAENPHGKTHFEFTLDMHSAIPVCDLGEFYIGKYGGKVLGDSYVVAGKFRGHIEYGGKYVLLSGIMGRDHSWGNRDWSGWSSDHWGAVYGFLDDANTFICFTNVPELGADDFAVVHDKNGTRDLGVPTFHWDFGRAFKGAPEGSVYIQNDSLPEGQHRLKIKPSLVIPYWQSSCTSSNRNQLWCQNVSTFHWNNMDGVGLVTVGYSGESVSLPKGLERIGDPPSF
ncbi:hypothetical protein ACFV2N_47045 [Streptomyces sp. NPDC059680]|uniref:hypothetical protein n=1 Tax=Streptomyces sp. NPDC059680 TaxID=3346904 RepID=UPI0036A97AEC